MTQSIAQTSPGAPDWATQTEEIHCPLCDYNLRGLIEPRCPECGYVFEWASFTDPARKIHPYLFEHHPEKNTRSFVRTVLGQLLPRRFWRSLRPEMPASRKRLLIYWWLLVVATFVPFIAHLLVLTVWQTNGNRENAIRERILLQDAHFTQDRDAIIRSEGSINAYINRVYPMPNSIRFWTQFWQRIKYDWNRSTIGSVQEVYLIAIGFFCTWPWLTFGVMSCFRGSMRLAKISAGHFMRMLIYSSDVMLIPVLALLSMELMGAAAGMRGVYYEWSESRMSWALLAAILLFFYRLIVAHKLYLKFKPVAATVLGVQLIVALLVAVFAFYVPGVFELVLSHALRFWIGIR